MAHITLQTDLPGLVLAEFTKPETGDKETKPEMIEAHAMSFVREDTNAKSTDLEVHFTMSDIANLPVFMKAMHQGTTMSIGVNVYDSPSFDREILYLSSAKAEVISVHMNASDEVDHPFFELILKFVEFTTTRFVLNHAGDNDKAQLFSYEPDVL